MNIVCLLFDRVTLLDAVGPLEVLSRLPGSQVHLVGRSVEIVRASYSGVGVAVSHDLAHAPRADILLIPGGPGVRELLNEEPLLEWVRRAHADSCWTASVCTGSLLLAAAGLLQGKPATTHWNAMEELRCFGAIPVRERVVCEGKLIMGAGVSAGIDMALTLAARVAGDELAQATQLCIEYDPAPPFDSGAVHKVGEAVRELARRGPERSEPIELR